MKHLLPTPEAATVLLPVFCDQRLSDIQGSQRSLIATRKLHADALRPNPSRGWGWRNGPIRGHGPEVSATATHRFNVLTIPQEVIWSCFYPSDSEDDHCDDLELKEHCTPPTRPSRHSLTPTTPTTAQRLDSLRLRQPPTDLPDARTTPYRVTFSSTAPEEYTSVLDSNDQDGEDSDGGTSPYLGQTHSSVVMKSCMRSLKASTPASTSSSRCEEITAVCGSGDSSSSSSSSNNSYTITADNSARGNPALTAHRAHTCGQIRRRKQWAKKLLG